jgi:hypothetical protein
VSSTEDKSGSHVITEPVLDLYLRMLISLLERDGSHRSSMPITLTTNGGVVYGDLITREAWKAVWAEQMETATGVGVEAVKTFPDDIDAAIDQVSAEEGEGRPEDDGMRYFVHLKNATVFVPGMNQLSMPSWRGRLDSITGWSIGKP